jgi:hypothetical protein
MNDIEWKAALKEYADQGVDLMISAVEHEHANRVTEWMTGALFPIAVWVEHGTTGHDDEETLDAFSERLVEQFRAIYEQIKRRKAQ